jgi:uncharacterized membrane protein
MGARLRLDRDGGSVAEVSRFLWTRGLWLIVVEITVMRLAMNFSFDPRYPVLLIILWALGLSMVAMAALIRLPGRVVGVLGLLVITLHNTLDGVAPAQFGALAWLWTILHQPGLLAVGGVTAVAGYPVLPWLGVMALGFGAGEIYRWPQERRLRVLTVAGFVLVAAFLILRGSNLYGDLSFLNTTKYPPSLVFLLMTLGPAAWLLAALERRPLGLHHPFVVFGRVPFAYYVVHFWLLHVAAATLAFVRYGGASFAFLWHPLPSMGGARDMFPPDLGVSLGWVYVAWALLVTGLYPAARWLAGVKARRRDWWLGYL